MKSINKILLSASLLLLFAVIALISSQAQALNEIKNYEVNNNELSAKVTTQEQTINALNGQLDDANQLLTVQEPIINEFKNLSQYIDFDSFETTQLEKAKNISDATPLDYESALVLVKYADVYDIPYSLVLSIIEIESNFTNDLVGNDQDRGYMQIIPGTEKWLATEFGSELGLTYDTARIFEPEYNLALGIKYLDQLMNAYGANYERILSEYNRGPSNLKRYFVVNQTYSTSYSRNVLSKAQKYVALNN